jgi:hypothetical protein
MKNSSELACPILMITGVEWSRWGTELRIYGYYDSPGGITYCAIFSGCSDLRWESVEADADVVSSSMVDVIGWQIIEQTDQYKTILTTEAFELAVTCESYELVKISEARETSGH